MPKIDTALHYSPKTGKMYYPSKPWGIHFHALGCTPTNGGPLSSDCAKNKQEAMEKAQSWCRKEGRSAEIFRRRDGAVAMRYWMDSVGLQYMQF
jgi:hypothetical protein